MKHMQYCETWFWAERSPTKPLTAAQARKRHENRQKYAVVVGGFAAPIAVIQLINDFVPVTFFDLLLRCVLDFHFEEMEPGKLRLTMATRRVHCEATPAMAQRLQEGRKHPDQPWGQFLADIDRVIDGRTITFKPDGSTYYRASRHGDSRILRIPGPYFDASGQTEPYPEFGHYEHLLKRERGLPWGPGLDWP